MTNKTKSKRALAFDRKRASRFEARGARVDNITSASVGLTGYADDGDSCALCDHRIKWLFILHLTLSDGRTETFTPVGSSCIESWADSLPVSDAQRAILDALKLAVADANEIKSRFRAINRITEGSTQSTGGKRGQITREQADALIAFYSAPKDVREHEFLSDVAEKVLRFHYFTERQWSAFARVLKAVTASTKRKSDRLQRQSDVGEESADDRLLSRARAVIESGQADAYARGDTLKDIADKGERWGFTDGQRRFMHVLLREAEAERAWEEHDEVEPAPEEPEYYDDLPF